MIAMMRIIVRTSTPRPPNFILCLFRPFCDLTFSWVESSSRVLVLASLKSESLQKSVEVEAVPCLHNNIITPEVVVAGGMGTTQR